MLCSFFYIAVNPHAVICIVTGPRAGRPRSKQQGQGIFFFSLPGHPDKSWGPTEPPVQWIPGVKWTGH